MCLSVCIGFSAALLFYHVILSRRLHNNVGIWCEYRGSCYVRARLGLAECVSCIVMVYHLRGRFYRGGKLRCTVEGHGDDQIFYIVTRVVSSRRGPRTPYHIRKRSFCENRPRCAFIFAAYSVTRETRSRQIAVLQNTADVLIVGIAVELRLIFKPFGRGPAAKDLWPGPAVCRTIYFCIGTRMKHLQTRYFSFLKLLFCFPNFDDTFLKL